MFHNAVPITIKLEN